MPLVLVLNEFPDVMTLDSCQGGAIGPAHVFFRHRGGGRAAAVFVADLAAYLAPHEAAADYFLAAEWRPGSGEPVFRLTCPAAHVEGLAAVLSGAFGLLSDRYGRALRS